MLLGQFREVAELNDVDTIGRDFGNSAYRERGKSNQSSIEEAWGTTFLILPPDLAPMLGRLRTLETVAS